MSLALYRRYRPETFEQVIGQDHVTRPLQQALRNQRVNHAYLFSGPRGCGKTTSARILARCLNCAEGPTPTPCGVCKSCVDLARGGPGSIDVIEIDAASHGGVDDARDLRERAFFAPVSSTYKIYILDEAHMVSSAGFNALLKVVEEPPPHLKFIFATTEPEKVIGTIRSRTHHYPFRLVPPGVLRDYLAELCGQENIPVAPEVLPLVVRAGAGSVRDSLSVLDQLLAGADENGVTYAMATSLLGYTDASLLDETITAFAAGDGAAAFQAVDRVVEGGHDPRRFLADLLERLRDLVILSAVPDAVTKGLVAAPGDQLTRMQEQAGAFGAAELSRTADVVSVGLLEMRGATAPRLQLELVCARVLLPGAEDSNRGVAARLDRLERGISSGAFAGAAAQPTGAQSAGMQAAPGHTAPAAPAMAADGAGSSSYVQGQEPQVQAQSARPTEADGALAPPPWRQPAASAQPQAQAAPANAAPVPSAQTGRPAAMDMAAMRQAWPQVLAAVRERSKVAWSMINEYAQVLGVDGQVLQLGISNPGLRDNFSGSAREEALREVLQKITGQDWKIDVLVDPSAGVAGPATPRGSNSGQGQGQGQNQGYGQGQNSARPAAQAEPAQAQSAPAPTASAASAAPQPARNAQASAASAGPMSTAPSGAGSANAAPVTSLEDDQAAPDDMDLAEAGPTARDLLIRELGASVLEEHENVD